MARVARVRVYPVKGLDGHELDRATIRSGGTLAHDREFALFDADGEVVNGKRTDRVHDLTTAFDPETAEIAVDTGDGETRRFSLDAPVERQRGAEWFGDFFDADLRLDRDAETGFVDRPEAGPSVVSTATLETVAGWFDDLTVDGVRRRLRANVEIAGVPAFWEDRFVGEDAPAFRAGDVCIEGVTPCGRCVVPTRDPDTGDPTPGFRERFLEKREETFPAWADRDAFDHLYSVMLIARVPERDRGKTIEVGDPVEILED
jgi:uncharacterized protein YcbX